MERKFSVRYKRAAGEKEHGIEAEKPSMNTFDRDTDTKIFALGDAAQGADFNMTELDQILQNFGMTLQDAFSSTQNIISDESARPQPVPQAQMAPSASSAGGPVEAAPPAASAPPSGDLFGPNQNVQVSTITKTLPDGRTVQTRVFRGPIQQRKRIMKISRELPNGETELLGTFEGDQNLDISQALQTALSQSSQTLFQNSSVQVNGPVESSVVNNQKEVSEKTSGEQSHVPDADGSKSQPLPKLPTLREFKPTPFTNSSSGSTNRLNQSSPRVTFQDTALPLDGAGVTPPSSPMPCSPPSRESTFRCSVQSGSSMNAAPRKSLASEEAIMMYQPDELAQDMEDDVEKGICPCCPRLWTRKTHPLARTDADQFKGKLGMTQSEINQDDKALPGLQALVANYARMLYVDKPAFIQTLYRAVKLDKLDVVKILCKIIHKCGFKLSSNEIREPESSATILHVALLYNHKNIVEYLVNRREIDLILAKYENAVYHNQTALHVAVANGDQAVVESLLSVLDEDVQSDLINTVANGKYFRTQHPHGQLCLTAAAWAGNGEIIKTLVKHGGNLALKNHRGNTLVHSIILQSIQCPQRKDHESILMAVWEATGIWAEQMVYDSRSEEQRNLEQSQMQIDLFKELLAIRNNDGYTPLALASKMDSKLFKFLMNFEKIYKIPQNKLGSITWVTYDVTDITSFAYDNYNKFSILHIIAHNSQRLNRHASLLSEDMEDFLEMEPITALHACKWRVYRVVYIVWLFIHLSYMILFTACTVETNSSPIIYGNVSIHDLEKTKIHYGFVSFITLPAIYIVLEILDLLGNKPYRIHFMAGQNFFLRCIKCIQSEWTITGNGPYRLVNIGFSYFMVEWFFLYISRDENQDISLAMTLLLGWIYVLFFTRGCRVTCRFSIMIQKMFFRDLIYFLTVYGIILISFSFAMNAMFTYIHNADSTISTVFYDMMNVVTDLDKKQSIDHARHPLFARLLLIFYAIVAVILLMNMLIAMMNTSYETIRVTRVNLWKQQQLSIMLMMERRLFWWKWLCRKSESDMWRKEDDDDMRCFLDVTVLHTPSYKTN